MKELFISGESKYLEYKKQYTKTLLKTVGAFANYHDGYIIIGIDDSKNILGVENTDSVRLSIENAINDSITPKPYFEIYCEEVEHKNLVVLKVYKGDNTPYTIDNKAYKRMDTSTVQVDKFGYGDLILRGRNLSYEALIYEGKELTFTVLGSKLKERLNVGVITDDILKSLELIAGNGYTNAAALLSDYNPLPNADIALIRFDENSVLNIKDRIILSDISIVSQFDRCMDFYSKHINTKEIIDGAYRRTIEEIPKIAYREAIANAIVHRDYSRNGDIKVEIYDNRVEIVSPGGLPIGISEEEYLDGKISIPRNRIVADIFLRLNVIEKLATGIRRIKEYYKDSGVSPTFNIGENSIKVILPKVDSTFNNQWKRNNNIDMINNLSAQEKIIYDYIINKGNINRSTAEEVLQLKKTQSIEVINALQKKGLIVKLGIGKGTMYVISN